MQVPHIYFDIDKTLINSSQLLSNCGQSLEQVGLDRDLFTRVLDEYVTHLPSKTSFDPSVLLQRVSDISNINVSLLEKQFWQPANFTGALYPDTVSTLKRASSTSTLGTYSQGVFEWQQLKLRLSGIEKFFSKDLIIIEADKSTDSVVTKLTQNSIVIDDKKEVLEHLKKVRSDLCLIWIVRDQLTDVAKNRVQALSDIFLIQQL